MHAGRPKGAQTPERPHSTSHLRPPAYTVMTREPTSTWSFSQASRTRTRRAKPSRPSGNPAHNTYRGVLTVPPSELADGCDPGQRQACRQHSPDRIGQDQPCGSYPGIVRCRGTAERQRRRRLLALLPGRADVLQVTGQLVRPPPAARGRHPDRQERQEGQQRTLSWPPELAAQLVLLRSPPRARGRPPTAAPTPRPRGPAGPRRADRASGGPATAASAATRAVRPSPVQSWPGRTGPSQARSRPRRRPATAANAGYGLARGYLVPGLEEVRLTRLRPSTAARSSRLPGPATPAARFWRLPGQASPPPWWWCRPGSRWPRRPARPPPSAPPSVPVPAASP